MAARRMFAKTIIDSDAFLDMPVSARLLYYDLGMRADDDGFVNSPKKVMRMIGATKDDLSILVMRNFVIPFESGVLVITHWKMHNYIQADRYKPTVYEEEKSRLKILNNKAYSLDVSSMDTEWIQDVSSLDTQVRLGKDNKKICAPEPHENVHKSQKDDQFLQDFEVIYELYPKKKGRTAAYGLYRQWVTKGREVNGQRYILTNAQIWRAVNRYVQEQEAAGVELQFWKNFDTLMGKQLLDYVNMEEGRKNG